MLLHIFLVNLGNSHKPPRGIPLPHNKQVFNLLSLVQHHHMGNLQGLVEDKVMAKLKEHLARLNQAMDNPQAKGFPQYLCLSQMWPSLRSRLRLLPLLTSIQCIYQGLQTPELT
jgi:hypothetical protein